MPTPHADIERVPPHDLEAEAAVLGSILLEPTQFGRVKALLQPTDFYRGTHREVFHAMLALDEEGAPPDPLLVRAKLVERAPDALPPREVPTALSDLLDVPSPAHASHYAGLVRRTSEQRRLILAAYEIQQAAWEAGADPSEIQRRALQQVTAASTPTVVGGVEWKTVEEEDPGHEEVEWLWDRYVGRERVTLLTSLPGIGKTTLYYGLVSAMLHRTPLLGASTGFSPAVILTEEAPADWRTRAKRFGLHDCAWLDARDLAPHQGLEVYCEEAYRKALTIGAYLVVIDSWAIWAGFGKDEEKDAGASQEAFRHIRALASRGMAVLLIHHMRKSGGEQGTAARGSGYLMGAVETGLELLPFGVGRGQHQADQRCLKVSKSRDPRKPHDLVYEHDPATDEARANHFVCRGDPGQIREVNILRRVVDWVLAQPEAVSSEEVKAALNMNRKAAADGLRSAYNDGVLSRIGTGRRGDPYRYGALQDGAP